MTDELIEYRVKPVTRYIVTRFERDGSGAGSVGSCGTGEFENAATAYQVAYALARADHERKGWGLADPRIQYPTHPDLTECIKPA